MARILCFAANGLRVCRCAAVMQLLEYKKRFAAYSEPGNVAGMNAIYSQTENYLNATGEHVL